MTTKCRSKAPPASSPAPLKEPRREPVQARSRETQRYIFDATAQVLAAGGVDALTMSDVAKRAGVNGGTVYHFFATKEALLAAWEEHRMGEILSQLMQEVTRIRSLDPLPKLAHSIHSVTHMGVLLLAQHAALYKRPVLEGLLSRNVIRWQLVFGAVEPLSALIQNRPGLRPANLKGAIEVALIAGCTVGFSQSPNLSPEERADEAADMITRYLIDETV